LRPAGEIAILPGISTWESAMDAKRYGVMIGLAGAALGCGGGVALMHPAHTLPLSTITMGAGVSGNFVVADARNQIDGAIDAVPQPGTAVSAELDDVVYRGFLAQTFFSPGLAPWVGARAGLGYQSEAGVTYTGRSARLDGRHAFEAESYALSLGLGASGHLMHPGSYRTAEDQQCTETPTGTVCDPPVLTGQVEPSGEIPGFAEVAVTGWALDLPVLAGWRSRAALVQVWTGARTGLERLWGDCAWQIGVDQVQEAQLAGYRWFVGGLVGLAVGVGPLWAAFEFEIAYHRADTSLEWQSQGDAYSHSANLTGVTATPTAALVGKF
jgi:hypothetical protein